MLNSQIRRILKQVKYKDWIFKLEERPSNFVLQVLFYAPDTETGKVELQHCRKWFISRHACKAEIVRTAYKAILAAEEHEVQENFLYRGVPIHSPHLNPDALARVYRNERKPFNRRKPK